MRNNYSKRSAIQSAISSYSNIEGLEPEEIINIISKEYSREKSEITEEYESWEIMRNKKLQENPFFKGDDVIQEDGADITIHLNQSSLLFNIKNIKSFPELERILIVINSMMNMFHKYINQSKIMQDNIIQSYFDEYPIEVLDFAPIEKKSKITYKDLNEIYGTYNIT